MKKSKIITLSLGVIFYLYLILLYLFPHLLPTIGNRSGGVASNNLIVFCQNNKCSQGFTLEQERSFWHEQKINVMKDASPKLLNDFYNTISILEEKPPNGIYRLDPHYDNYEGSLEVFRTHKKKQLNNTKSGLIHVNGQWRIDEDYFGPIINYGELSFSGIPELPNLKNKDLSDLKIFEQFYEDIKRQIFKEYFAFSSWKMPKFIIFSIFLISFLFLVIKNSSGFLYFLFFIFYVVTSWSVLFFQILFPFIK